MVVQLVFHWINAAGEVWRVTDLKFNSVDDLEKAYTNIDKDWHCHVFPVNRSFATPPPPGWRPDVLGNVWCPYCCNEREFIADTKRELTCCEVCGVSERDYHYREHNGLLESIRKRKGEE